MAKFNGDNDIDVEEEHGVHSNVEPDIHENLACGQQSTDEVEFTFAEFSHVSNMQSTGAAESAYFTGGDDEQHQPVPKKLYSIIMDAEKNKDNGEIQIDALIDPEDNIAPSPPVLPRNESVLSVHTCCTHSVDSSLNMQPTSVVSPSNESVVNVQQYCRQSCDASLNIQSTSSEKSLTSSQKAIQFAQTARPITSVDDQEYLKHIEQLPDDLREENIDILIINAESDRKAAAGFKNNLERNILFYMYGQPRCPRVKLLDEIRHGSMDNLDFAFSKTLFTFLFASTDFCEEFWTLLKSHACLTESIENSDKQWCVIPIHTTSKKIRRYKLPMMLNTLRPINYCSGDEDQFYIEGVRKLLESKTSLLLERERLLDERRKQYFEDNRDKILENEKYKDKGLFVCTNVLSYTSSSNYSPLTDPASAVEDSSKLSDLHTSSSDVNVYQTDVYRYFSFTDTHDDKALPDVSLAVVEESMEEIAVSENVAVVQDNDLRVNIRCSTTDRSSQRPNQEAAHQLSEGHCEMSERIHQQVSGRNHESQNKHAQQVSTRSHELQSHTPQQVPGRNEERQNKDIPQQTSDRSYERQSQGALPKTPGRSHERQSQGALPKTPGRSHERQSQGALPKTPGRSHERQCKGTPQQVSSRSHERHSQGGTQLLSSRSHERHSPCTTQQASGRSFERQSQDTHHQVPGRSYGRHTQGINQRSQISTVNAPNHGIKHGAKRNKTFITDGLNPIDVDGPEGDSSSFPAHENQASHLYQHRSVPATTELYQSNTYPAPAHFSAPQYMPSRTDNPGYPTSSPMLGHVNYPLPNFVNASDTTFYMPRLSHPGAFYPYSYPHPHVYSPFPSQHYLPGQPYTLQGVYSYVNHIPPPNYFFQTDMRSQSQTSLVGPSNDITQTSMKANTPDSVRPDLSHSLSTGALSAFGSSPGISNHWPPSENLSFTNVPFPPQPISNRHIPSSHPRINQVEGVPTITAQPHQSHIPVAHGSFEANYFGTRQAVGAAGTHSSTKSDRAPSA